MYAQRGFAFHRFVNNPASVYGHITYDKDSNVAMSLDT